MGIFDQVVSWTARKGSPPTDRPTLSTPRRNVLSGVAPSTSSCFLSASRAGPVPSISSTLSEQFRAPTPSDQPPSVEVSSPSQRRGAQETIDEIRSAAIYSGHAEQERAARRARRLHPATYGYLHEQVVGVSPVASRACSAHDLTPSALPGQNHNVQGYGVVDRVRAKASAVGSIARRRRESSDGMLHAAAAAERLAAATSQEDLMLRAECEAVKRLSKKSASNQY